MSFVGAVRFRYIIVGISGADATHVLPAMQNLESVPHATGLGGMQV
jgi:hypothetical protein